MGKCLSRNKGEKEEVDHWNSSQRNREEENHHNVTDSRGGYANTTNSRSGDGGGTGETLVAMYDYEARSEQELTFRKGQRLEFILAHDEGVWIKARDMTTGREGYVPAAFTAPISAPESRDWFFGDIPRKHAEQHLLNPVNGKGAFLVRRANQDTHKYSLSVKDFLPSSGTFGVRHYRIKEDEMGRLYTVRSNLFYSLYDLIEAYSRVYGEKYEVAVKTLKPGSMTREAFMKEATIMKKLLHNNIVSLYAVCTTEEPIYIITEYMKAGALLTVLKDERMREALDLNSLVFISSQVANGMAYLETKNFVHRDLAARNVLVDDGLVCKIADFGLARTTEGEYTPSTVNKFPVKWTAPEALLYNTFSIKSDVWSFGILLYEIFTYGAIPYPGMTNQQVAQIVPSGYRMDKPTIFLCPDEIYELMRSTWQMPPMKRPTFEHLYESFSQLEILGNLKDYQDQSNFRE